MKKSAILSIIITVVLVISFGIFFGRDLFQSENINKLDEEILKKTAQRLGGLCATLRECEVYCIENQFACEVYCVKNSENAFCKERFAYLDADQQTLLRFPAFRNYNYTFKDGKLVEKNPVVQNIGVIIDYYDSKTNKAGDFVFTKFTYPWGEIFNNKIFFDYGESEGEKNGTIERNPQLVYNVPLGTKVHAIGSGIVTAISPVYSGDVTIFIIHPESPSWIYEHEHVINPTVNVGDYVEAGQVIAEVSNYSEWQRKMNYGVVDIGLFRPTREYPAHHCPPLYFNESHKADTLAKINALYRSWEAYEKNSSIYDEHNYPVAGCVITDVLSD